MTRNSMTNDPRDVAEKMRVRWSNPPRRSARDYADLFHTNPGMDSVALIADTIGNTKYKIFRTLDHDRDPEHASPVAAPFIEELLKNPMPDHPEMDGYTLKYLTVVYKKILGEFFWLLERDNAGRPRAAYPILPQWVISCWTVNTPYFRILPMGNTSYQQINVAQEDIVWFKEPDALNPYGRGRGRAESIGDEMEADEYAAKYQKNLMFNDAQPPIIVSLPDSGEEVVAQLNETWLQKLGGWINARKPMITNAKIEVQKLTDTPREMDMVESRKYLRDVMNQHWSMPPELRGIIENSNRATIDSAYYLYSKNVISRELIRFETQLNRQLVPMFDPSLCIAFDDVVPQDEQAKKLDADRGLAAGTMTVNEWRQAYGMEEAPDGNAYLRAFSVMVVPAGQGDIPAEPAAPETGPVSQDTEIPLIEALSYRRVKALIAPRRIVKAMNAAQRHAMLVRIDRIATEGEPMFTQALKGYGTEQRNRIDAIFKRLASEGMSPEGAMKAAEGAEFTEAAAKKLKNALRPAWMNSFKGGFDIADELLGGGISFDLYRPIFGKIIDSIGLEKAKGINETTKEALRRTMKDGIAAGESHDTLAARVQETYRTVVGEKADATRATMIARTETMASVNGGQFEVYREEGILEKEWCATLDDRTRPDHLAADTQRRLIDEPFDIGGESLDYPGWNGGSAENVIQCRCCVLPVIPD